ncbi:hypothetical protein EVA_12827, partial [gut metagenome]
NKFGDQDENKDFEDENFNDEENFEKTDDK